VIRSLRASFKRLVARLQEDDSPEQPNQSNRKADGCEVEAAHHSSPIFIGGTGRSGTTAVARLLGLHRNVFTVKWESQFIVAPNGLADLLPKIHQRWCLGDFTNRMRGEWFRRTLNQGKPNEYVAGLCDDVEIEEVNQAIQILESFVVPNQSLEERHTAAAEFIHALFLPAVNRAGARRWGEKTPRNIFYIDTLYAMFPDMKFIDVVRDGRDVVSSMMEHGFWPIAPSPAHPETERFSGPMTFEKAVDYWITMMEIGREKAAKVPTSAYLKIRLEDLVDQPNTTLLKILDFIDEPFDENLLTYDLSRSHRERWRQDFSPEQCEWFLGRAGNMLVEEGYL
jgi:hypothetical protein